MTVFLQGLATFIFFSSLKASALIALVLLAQKALGRFLSPNGLYLLWLPIVFSLLIPFGFKTVIPQSSFISQQLVLPTFNTLIPANFNPEADKHAPQPPALQPAVNDSAVRQVNASSSIAWLSLLSLAWLAGALVLLGIVLVRNIRFSRLVREAVAANGNLQQLLAVCCKETNCKSTVRLLVSPAIEAPLITGCFTPTLLLPEGIDQQLNATQLRHVFLHELMHVKRFDIAGNWLLTLMLCLHWFNPLVWFALTRMRDDRELVCDAAILPHLGPNGGQAYGLTLLQLCQPQPRLFIATHGIGIVGSKSELRRRIASLVQTSFPTRKQSVLTGLLLLILGGLAFSKPVVETAQGTAAASAGDFVVSTLASLPPPAPASAITLPEPAQVTDYTSLAAPTHGVVKSKTASSRSSGATITVQNSSTATESARVTDQTVASALLAMADKNSPDITTSAAEINATAPQEIWSGWIAMGELTRSISEAKSAGLQFISEWNTTASACQVSPGQHKRRIPCERVKIIKSSNQLGDFKLQCAALAAKYNKLARDYSASAAIALANREAIAATMLRNYQDLTEFCSTDTYTAQYPAFAKLFNSATSNLDLVKAKKALADSFSSTALFTYAGDGNGNNYSYSPRENNGPNPAYVGTAAPGTGSTGASGTGSSTPASSNTGTQTH